jgi:hypothetical protein
MIQAGNTALINQRLNRGTKVVFISSFPRSGNTWMRGLLRDILFQEHGVATTTDLPVALDDLIPEIPGSSIIARLTRCPDWACEAPVAFVKTHFLFAKLDEILSDNSRRCSEVRSPAAAPIRDCKIL